MPVKIAPKTVCALKKSSFLINIYSSLAFSVTKEDTTNKESVVFPDHNDAAFSQHSDSFVIPTIRDTDSSRD